MPGGRPRKPTEQKRREGTLRKDRSLENELTPPPGVPVAPKWLDKEARVEWDRVVPQLAALGVLTGLDGGALERYCVAHSNWIRAQRAVQKEGTVIKTPFGPQKNPNVKIALDERAAARLLATELGLSPSSRSRVKAPEKPPAKDTAAEETPIFGMGLRAIPGGGSGSGG